MKQILLTAIFLLIVNGCKSQERSSNINSETMKTFDIKKFEENKGKSLIYDDPNLYDYKTNDGYYIIQTKFDEDNIYKEEKTKEFSPFKSVFIYYDNGNLYTNGSFFNSSPTGISKEYDKNGELKKEINEDKNFKHSFEEIHDIVLKERKIDIYDTRQAVALRHDTPFAVIKKYYQIHVLKSQLVDGIWYAHPNYSFLINDETGKEWDPEVEKENNSYYKTYKGKDYTKKEWEAFEEQWYKDYKEQENKKGFWR